MLCVHTLQAGYLAKAGKSVAVFERRSVLGGAAVTEEIIPGREAMQHTRVML